MVKMTGASWFGFETSTFCPHLLWMRNYSDIINQIAAVGLNTVRLPYSNEMFLPGKMPNGIDFKLNQDLEGLTPLEIMDKIIKGITDKGIMVFLDRHRPDSQGQSELWYTDHVSEQTWTDCWCMLADRYKDNKLIIGGDLHNEPRGQATWGTGDTRTDWNLAAERCGSKILEIAPHWKIIVEGIESYDNHYYWWGGNLRGVRSHPVNLPKGNLIYSTHDYSPLIYLQQQFLDPTFPNNLSKLWDDTWGYISKEGLGQVLVGEFGGRHVDTSLPGLAGQEAVWMHTLLDYMAVNDISWTYWAWQFNSGDTGGLTTDDGKTLEQAKIDLLTPYMAPLASAQNTAPGEMPPENPPGGDYGQKPKGLQ